MRDQAIMISLRIETRFTQSYVYQEIEKRSDIASE